MCILSLICALALGYFDKRADRILKRAAVTSGNFLIILLFSSLNGVSIKYNKRGKDKESMQSSTMSDPGYQWEIDKYTI